MVNTRILEKRLGWRAGSVEGETTPPPAQVHGHRPVLQGRVEPTTRTGLARPARRAAVDDLWQSIPLAETDMARLASGTQAPAFDRGSIAGVAMDQLRAQLIRVLQDKGWRRIGVTSPYRGAGRSFVAAALSASIARLETLRVLLLDADLESPGLADFLGLEAPGPLDDVLGGLVAPQDRLLRVGSSLALALNDTPVPQATERMMMPEAILSLRALIDALAPDVVIHDLPPLLDDPLTQALLPQLDAVLLVADAQRTTAQDILVCERQLEGVVPMLGVVLNKSEDRDPRSTARRRG